jgi:solute carrier family 25 folate transporter 32
MPSAPPWTSHSAIAGAGAGLVSSIVTCPLDVVKTKLQAQKIAHHQVGYMGVYGARPMLSAPMVCSSFLEGTVRHIAKHDGLRGFYRGLGPTLMGYLPTWAIYFYMYDGIKERFGGRHDCMSFLRSIRMTLHAQRAWTVSLPFARD